MNKLLRHIHEHSLDSLHSGLIVGAGNGSQSEMHGSLAAGDSDAGHSTFQCGNTLFQNGVGRV